MGEGGSIQDRGPPAIRMAWSCLLFCHWPVEPEALRPLVPEALEIDTFGGRAWVGLIPFTMPAFRVRWLPRLPSMRGFHECNVRTYATLGGEPGVWFFSLDAASRLAAWGGRRFWGLNYRAARIELGREGDTVRCWVRRRAAPQTALRCAWEVGAPRPQTLPGDLDHFLTERYALFTTDRRGRPRIGRIHHRPWSLREARLLDFRDSLVAAAGITIGPEPPVLYAADPLEVVAWRLRPQG